MLRLTLSNRPAALAAALAERVAEVRAPLSPLTPLPVVVATGVAAAFLKMELARRHGIAANLRFLFLPRLQRDLLAQAGAPAPLEREGLELAVAAALERLDDPELAPLAAYLGAHDPPPEAQARRRAELAQEITRLFERYLIYRPELLTSWSNGQVGTAAEERWQAALYLRLFGPGGPLDRRTREPRDHTLWPSDLWARLPDQRLVLPPALFVYDLPHLTPPEVALLARLGARTRLELFAFDPSREFWDDVRQPGDNALLAAFGRAGRDRRGKLLELCGYDFDARFVDPLEGRPLTALGALQQDALLARAELEEPQERPRLAGPDPSVQFLACPSVRRELERAAEELWATVERGEAAFHQTAIILPEGEYERYRAQASAVFAEHGRMPHHFLDVPLTGMSRLAEAVTLLLALPFSRFHRNDLLRLLLHPTLLRRVPGAPAAEWLRWIDELTVIQGADRGDQAGSYLQKDLYNWSQGTLRLALGACMSGARSGVERAFCLGEEAYLPLEQGLDRLGSAARLYTLVRSLIADARFCRRERLPLAEWTELIHWMLASYLGTPEEAPAAETAEELAHAEQDERDLHKILEAVAELGRRAPSPHPVDYRQAHQLVLGALGALKKSAGQPLADGVAVGPLSALSSLPFRVVLLLGLGEGRFPRAEPERPLDVAPRRRAGDPSLLELDQWRLLERVLVTEQRVLFSWVAREEETGDAREPSGALIELRRLLARETGWGEEALTEQVALRRHDAPELARHGQPAARRRERRALELRRSAMAHLAAAGVPPLAGLPLPATLAALLPPARARLERELGLNPAPAEGPAPGPLLVSTSALRRFLEDPDRGWQRIALGLSEDEEQDPYARESESFAASRLDASVLLRGVLSEHLLQGPGGRSLEDLYAERARYLELAGVLPTGLFLAPERRRHLGMLSAWTAALAPWLHGRRLEAPLAFGRGREHAALGERPGRLAEAIRLEVETPRGSRRVELYGRTELLARPALSVSAYLGRASEPGGEQRALRGYLDHLCLSALGLGEVQGHGALVLFGRGEVHHVHFLPLSREDARGQLTWLIGQVLAHPHPGEPSFEEVFRRRTRGHLAAGEAAAASEDRYRQFFEHRGLEPR